MTSGDKQEFIRIKGLHIFGHPRKVVSELSNRHLHMK